MPDAPPPPLRTVLRGDGAFRAALWSQAPFAEGDFPAGEWLAPEEEAAFAALGANEKRRREWLASRLALKDLLVRDGVVRAPREAIVRKDARGCPAVIVWEPDTGRYERVACSISHSAPYVLAAYARGRGARIGVDVEPRAWRLRMLRRKFVSAGDRMLEKDDAEGDDTLLWSFKESLSKLLGTGWGCGFRNLSCEETSPGVCALVDAADARYEGRYWWFGRFAATVVWSAPGPEPEPAAAVRRPPWSRLRRAWRLRRLRRLRRRAAAEAAANVAETVAGPEAP